MLSIGPKGKKWCQEPIVGREPYRGHKLFKFTTSRRMETASFGLSLPLRLVSISLPPA